MAKQENKIIRKPRKGRERLQDKSERRRWLRRKMAKRKEANDGKEGKQDNQKTK